MPIEEAIKRMENIITCEKCKVHGNPCDGNCPTQYDAGTWGECIVAMETVLNFVKEKTMAIEALEILEFAKKELQFAVEHTEGETKDHYQRALNLLIKENKQ